MKICLPIPVYTICSNVSLGKCQRFTNKCDKVAGNDPIIVSDQISLINVSDLPPILVSALSIPFCDHISNLGPVIDRHMD